MTKTEAKRIFKEAQEAATKAAKEATPAPMIVGSPSTPLGNGIDPTRGPVYYVSEGVCGFAGVVIRPARGALVTLLKAQGIGYKHYYGGWYVSAWQFATHLRGSQSYERQCAAARAAANVLSAAGIDVSVDSRLD